MENALFSFASFNVNGIQDGYNSLKGSEKEETLSEGKQDHLSGLAHREGIDSFCSEYGFFCQEKVADRSVHFPAKNVPPTAPPKRRHHQEPPTISSTYSILDDFQFNTSFLSTQPILENTQPGTSALAETKKEEQSAFLSAYLELLSNYETGFKKLKREKDSKRGGDKTNAGGLKLSTEEIIRVAGERYIQFSTQRDIFMLMHSYGSAFSGLSMEETQDVELVHLLLAAAEKVGYQQFERASGLLTGCEWMASNRGDPVQRVVYYFSEALRERIDRETGRFIAMRTEKKEKCDVNSQGMSSINPVFMKCHQELPFTQVMQFAGIQAILENVASETKIHLIDFQIRSGVQWIALMQALAERVEYPIEHLKLTYVGTSTDGEKTEETGKRLESFAKSLNLPFSFKVLLLSDMTDLQKEHFDIQACCEAEAVVVYSQIVLRTMISRPNCLENLMRVIRKLNPSIMVVVEVEANHNSPSFFNRFIEALFFYSAFFDCLEDCTDRDNRYRIILEEIFRDGICNIVAAEGEERFVRNVKMNVWKAFFARFGMVGIKLSEKSLYQGRLIIDQFAYGSSCTLQNDGNCLIVGWKGTPIHSLSTWKFR